MLNKSRSYENSRHPELTLPHNVNRIAIRSTPSNKNYDLLNIMELINLSLRLNYIKNFNILNSLHTKKIMTYLGVIRERANLYLGLNRKKRSNILTSSNLTGITNLTQLLLQLKTLKSSFGLLPNDYRFKYKKKRILLKIKLKNVAYNKIKSQIQIIYNYKMK